MKRKVFRLLGVFLSIVMVLGLMACGQSESGTKGNETQKSEKAPSGGTDGAATDKKESAGLESSGEESDSGNPAADDDTSGGGSPVAGVDWEDMAEITVQYPALGPIPYGLQEVEDAINAITEERINTHVTLQMIEVGNYAQQIGLQMSASEASDLLITLPAGPASYSALTAQNQIMDITELLDEYGSDIKEILGDKLKGTSVDGAVYGVTGNRTYVVTAYIIMRTDVLEDLGLLEKAKNMTTLTEYEEILAAVKSSDKWGNLAGIVSSDGQGNFLGLSPSFLGEDKFSDMSFYDTLGDTANIVAVSGDGIDTTVEKLYATDQFRKVYEKMHDWYEKGYVYKDVATDNTMAEELVKNNVAFSYFGNCEVGVETLKSTDCGMPVTCVPLVTYPIGTGSTTKFVWTIPNTAKEPEAAMAFLNLMFTNADINNLLAWGVEGRDYVVVDGQAAYPEGVTEVPYHASDFLFGNMFLTLPWYGDGADFRQVCQDVEKAGVISPYMGFTADTSEVTNEISALTNVIQEYRATVGSGAASPDVYEEFLKKLDANGIDKVIDLYQTQLNEWLADNK